MAIPFVVGLVICSPASAGQDISPQPFDLELRLDSMSGPLLSGYITDGRLVTAQGWVPLLGGSGKTVLGNLIWQLYDESGQPVAGYEKIRQILEVGGQEFVSFEVNTKALANGFYYLGFTHQNAAQPKLAFQVSKSFEVKQPVAITAFLVDESSQGTEHRPVLYEDQSPHVFVYYHLAYDVPSVLIQLDVFDSKGKQLATRSAYKDRDPTRKVSRFGVRLTPGLIPAGEKARMTALLTAPDGTIVAEEVFVEIVGLQLQVDMPAIVRTGEATSFQIMVPDTFAPPFTMSFSQKPGVTFNYAVGLPGVLEGTIKVAPTVATGREKFVMEVKDQAGRTASATVEVLVEPGRILTAPRSGGEPSRQQGSGGGIGSSPPPF
ncbi:MAG: hypothetical protein KKD73_02585 [Proteobacteria bacterium]|nr:hypothetical protein [Pseudomonadota bacterium]MBU1640356.1 hypothetical protein [Pseudomonadota bacterium]